MYLYVLLLSKFGVVSTSYSYLSQYGDPLIIYAADNQGHVTQIRMFILFIQIF
jgi:hypothetical protein